MQASVAAAVPGADVVDHDTVAKESSDEFTGGIDIVGNILLGFGGVSLFVSIFIIYNTFAIVLGQRTQELALLRTIGAGPTQIRRSVLGEALVIGVLASAGGIAGGIGVAEGLEALFNSVGGSLPDSPTIVATRTIVAAIVIGVGVTMVAAIGPARRAGTVPAIQALRGGTDATAPGSRTRIVAGLGLFGIGVGAGALGLAGAGSTTATIALMAIGAIGIFLSVTLLSPMAVDVITRVLGWPLTKTSGVAGRLAQQNAARNPRRTATTAAALMIGLALVSTALIVGQSIKNSVSTTLEESATADYYITDQLEDVTFPLGLTTELAANDTFGSVAGFRYVETRVDGEVTTNVAADFEQLPPLLNADIREGGYDTAVTNPVLVASKHAEANDLSVGDAVSTEFASGEFVDATITGIFHDEALITADFLYDESVFDAAGDRTGYQWIAVSVAEGA
ncbi:MAG: ABC transporter permease, partial [Actinomycetota bacterium]